MPENPRDRSREPQADARRPDFRRRGPPPTATRHEPATSSWQVYFLGLLALVAAITLVLFVVWPFLQTPVPFVAVALHYHDWPLAPNSLAQEDLESFEQAFGNYKNVSFVRSEPTEFSVPWLARQLETTRPGGPRRLAKGRRGVIVYLSGHGLVDDRGDACLLVPGEPWAAYLQLDQESPARVRVADVLRTVCEAEPLRGVDKLVVLDVGKMEVNWSLGWLHNTFASAVRRAHEAAGDPHLAVLCATDDGQRAWTDLSLRGSVFGHFFRTGLRGAASGDDRTLMLRELHTYLEREVARWVDQRFGAQQGPVLAAAPDFDFPLAYAAPDDSPPPDPWQVNESIARSQPLWDKYAQLCAAARRTDGESSDTPSGQVPLPAWSEDARHFAAIQGRLVRYQELVMAGAAYRGDAEQLEAELDRELTATLRRLADGNTGQQAIVPLGSLAASEPVAGDQVAAAFGAWDALRAQPPAEGAGPPPLPPEARAAYDAACAFAYARARNELAAATDETWPANVARYLRFVEEQRDASAGPEPAELQLLQWGVRLLEGPRRAQALGRAMEVRHALESTTAVADPRVAYWLAARWDEMSAQVRTAEDRLFSAGDTAAELIPPWDALWAPDGGGQLAACRDLGDGLTRAHAARDLAWAWLPPLGVWLDARARVPHPLPDTPPTVRLAESWQAAVAAAHELDGMLLRSLRAPPAERAASAASVPPIAQQLTKSIDALLDEYNSECAALLRPGENPQWRAQMDAALRVVVPTAPRERRSELWRTFAATSSSTTPPRSSASQATSASTAASPDASAPALWGRHPALRLLTPDHAETSPPDGVVAAGIDAAGAEVRRLLRARNGSVQQAAARADEALSQTPLAEPDRVRLGWVEADALVRPAAALTWGDPAAVNPGVTLRAFDRYVQLLRFAQRRLDDFWGATPEPGGASPLFAASCAQLLTRADDVRRTLLARADHVRPYQQEVERRLLARKEARLDLAVAPSADTVAAGDASAGRVMCKTDGDVVPGIGMLVFTRSTAPAPPFVPASVGGAERARTPLEIAGPSAEGLPFELAGGIDPRDVAAGLFYRGRWLSAPLPTPQQVRADVVMFRPRPRQPAKITVLGQAEDTSYIMFVLDCSGSMSFPGQPAENGTPRTRLQQAQDELPRIVESICTTYPKVELGLILFGHRAAEGTADAKTDVETVIDFGVHPRRPGDAADIRDDFARRIQLLQPNGETPLFVSLIEAMGRFPRKSRSEQCHVIVLSDGVDLTGTAAHTRLATQLRARIDVFEYQLSPKEREDARIPPAQQRMQAICEQSGGQYFADLTSWFDAISRLQQPKQFTVTSVAAAGWRAAANLGGVVEVEPAQLAGDFRIAVEGPEAVPVKLEGGEQLVLQYEASQLRFAAWPEVDDKEPLLTLGGRQLRLAALSPRQEGTSRVFRVALREYDPLTPGRAKFTPRPSAVWAEVETDSPRGTAVYPVLDLDFEPDHPGPVQCLTVADWPPEVDRALIRLWLSWDPRSPAFVHNGPVPSDSIRHEQSTFAFRPDTSADPPKFIVQQQLDAAAGVEDLFAYRVALAAPRVSRVEHRYYRELRKAEHVFVFEPMPGASTPEPPHVQITAKTDFLRTAVDEKPVLLPVSLR
ncbi:MAG: VWA domain-containing protein [Pirellulaceae bacterium]|nr:VWA domain-containing protein [Pirellulaceae bacterium]